MGVATLTMFWMTSFRPGQSPPHVTTAAVTYMSDRLRLNMHVAQNTWQDGCKSLPSMCTRSLKLPIKIAIELARQSPDMHMGHHMTGAVDQAAWSSAEIQFNHSVSLSKTDCDTGSCKEETSRRSCTHVARVMIDGLSRTRPARPRRQGHAGAINGIVNADAPRPC